MRPFVAPPFPESISTLTNHALRDRAEAAWKSAHVIVNAVMEWGQWLDSPSPEMKLGDEIARKCESAIRSLYSLGISSAALDGNLRVALDACPTAPSKILDVTYYANPPVEIQAEIDRATLLSTNVLVPAVASLIDVLAASPISAFASMPLPPEAETAELITLEQAAELIHKSVQTLHNKKTEDPPPPPVYEPTGKGQKHAWRYSDLRPWLLKHWPKFDYRLPESYAEAMAKLTKRTEE